MRRNRPGLRLLFDENLSWKVASALQVLGFHTAWVGGADQPRRGASDEEVLEHARRSNQTVVSANHDLFMLAAERRQTVVWIDGYGRQLTYESQVLICFRGIAEWEMLLADATQPVCLHVLRTRTHIMELSEAGRLAEQRLRKVQARKRRTATRKASAEGQMMTGRGSDSWY